MLIGNPYWMHQRSFHFIDGITRMIIDDDDNDNNNGGWWWWWWWCYILCKATIVISVIVIPLLNI